MKKLIAFFIIAIFLFAASYLKIDDFSLFQDYTHVVIISSKPYSQLEMQAQNGEQYYYDFNNTAEDKKRMEIIDKNNIDGYVFYYQLDKELDDFMTCFDFIYQGKTIDTYKVYYGYYSGYNDFCYVSGKKINFQLVKNENSWLLGFPLIITGY